MRNKVKIRKKNTLIIAISVIIAVTSFMMIYTASNKNIAYNVFVGDINAGGMTEEQLTAVLNEEYKNYDKSEILTIKVDGKQYKYTAQQLGVVLDIEGAVEATREFTASGNLFKDSFNTLKSLFIKEKIPFTFVNFDRDLLEQEVLMIQRETGDPGNPYKYDIDDENSTMTVTAGEDGAQINLNTVMSEATRIIQSLSKETYEAKIEAVTRGSIDKGDEWARINIPPQDATCELYKGELVFFEAKPGIEVDREKFIKALEAVEQGSPSEELSIKYSAPEVMLDEYKKLVFSDTIASRSISYNDSNIAHNIKKIVKKLNNKIIAPNGTFSFNNIVGRRLSEDGYKVAPTIRNGSYVNESGGGVSRAATAVFACAMKTNMKITSRKATSLAPDYVAKGYDAYVSYPDTDLKWKNTTNYPIKIKATASNSRVIISFVGTDIPGQKVKIYTNVVNVIPSEVVTRYDESKPVGYSYTESIGTEGYVIYTFRKVRENGKVVSNSRIAISHYNSIATIKVVGPSASISTSAPGTAKPDDELEEDYVYPTTAPVKTKAPKPNASKSPETDSSPTPNSGKITPSPNSGSNKTARPTSKPTTKPTSKPTSSPTDEIISLD